MVTSGLIGRERREEKMDGFPTIEKEDWKKEV